MKKSFVLIIVTIVLSTLANINAQQKDNTYAERNPFLAEKRHGAVIIVNKNSIMNSNNMIYVRNPFLTEKRHGPITFFNRNSSSISVSGNLIADRNPFLREKRHGAVLYRNVNTTTEINKSSIKQNFFLRQKRHQ